VWEQEGRGRVGVEAYYTSPQRRSDGSRTPGYLLAGLMAERRFGPVRVFVNFENVLDARQSRSAPLVTGTVTDPAFAEVWGPTDGFVANAGIKLDL
jgi:iron complex outermembrane receptor protein